MQQCCTENQFYVFLATAPTGVLTAATAGPPLKQIYGKGVAHLWKNKDVAPLQEFTVQNVFKILVLPGLIFFVYFQRR